jgi:hypothetical protein
MSKGQDNLKETAPDRWIGRHLGGNHEMLGREIRGSFIIAYFGQKSR